jgi:hypothetical protein
LTVDEEGGGGGGGRGRLFRRKSIFQKGNLGVISKECYFLLGIYKRLPSLRAGLVSSGSL